MKEILKKLRKYEIQIRKAINTQMQGDFHSIFKGSGLEFDDVRAYQYGDDVRAIDWNVSAKGHGVFIKQFKEEKELTVFFVVDVSGSQEIGNPKNQKIDKTKEIAALLSLSAIKENNQVGLLCFSDKKEKYIKAAKGIKHSYEIISSLFKLEPTSKGTDLTKAFSYTLQMIKRKSVVIVISDFIDEETYFHHLKGLGRKHDLVVIHISDKRETQFPKLGIIPLYDKESGKDIWVNTSAGNFRNKIEKSYKGSSSKLKDFCMRNQINYLSIKTDEDYVPKLIKLFRVRNKMRKTG